MFEVSWAQLGGLYPWLYLHRSATNTQDIPHSCQAYGTHPQLPIHLSTVAQCS